MGYFLFFDFETSGLGDFKKQKAIQLAWIISNKDFEIIHKKSYWINNQTKINTNFHKDISVEFLNKHGENIESVLIEFFEDVLDIIKNNGKLIAHNLEFDINILYNEVNNVDIKNYPSKKELEENYCLCSKNLTQNICKLTPLIRGNYKYPKLVELYNYLFHKEPEIKLHNAINDTFILYECCKELSKRNIL